MESESVQKISFKKERDFSELISATFNFFKQEYRMLARPLIFVFAPVALVLYLALDYITFSSSPITAEGYSYMFHWSYISKVLLIGISYFVLQVIVLSYIKEYIDSNGEVGTLNVRRNVSAFVWPALGWSIVTALIIGLGFIFLVIPGIFLIVATVLTVPSVFFDRERSDWPLGRSYNLIKGYWWFTFGLGLVFMVIMYVVQMALGIPLMIVVGVSALNSNSPDYHPGFLVLLYSNIVSVITLLLNVFSSILLSFHYFNLVEKKEMPSLLSRIDNIGMEQ